MSRNFVFQYQRKQINFFLSERMSIKQLCKLLKQVFEIEQEKIVAVKDINNNIYDIEYFWRNMHKQRDSFYFIITDYSKFFIENFSEFYENEMDYALTMILFIDQQQSQRIELLMQEIDQYYQDINKYFTLYQDYDNDANTILFTLFQNQQLLYEKEVPYDQNLTQNILYEFQHPHHNPNYDNLNYDYDHFHFQNNQPESQIYQAPLSIQYPAQDYQQQYQRPPTQQTKQPQQPIPLIVTKGNNQNQILQVEENDLFHSRQGKRQYGLQDIGSELLRIQNQFQSNDFQILQTLLQQQDNGLISAFHLFKRTGKEQQFLQNLKALVKEKDPSAILNDIINQKEFEPEELGIYKHLQNQNSEEFKELLDSLKNQNANVLYTIIKLFLKDQFYSKLQNLYDPSKLDIISIYMKIDKHPINDALKLFKEDGDFIKFNGIVYDNLPNESNPSSVSDSEQEYQSQKVLPQYSKLLKRQSIRKNTFQFTVMNNLVSSDGDHKQKKNSYDLEFIQTQKETLFLDHYHLKATHKTFQDYEKSFLSVVDNQDEFDEQEKKVLLDFYQMSNQRLFEILDHYQEKSDFQEIKQDLMQGYDFLK